MRNLIFAKFNIYKFYHSEPNSRKTAGTGRKTAGDQRLCDRRQSPNQNRIPLQNRIIVRFGRGKI